MRDQGKAIQQFIIKNLPNHATDIVAIAMRKFSVTRTTVLRHLNYLIVENKATKTGRTRQIQYFLTRNLNKSIKIALPTKSNEFLLWKKYFETPVRTFTNQNTFDICEYGFTEMVNNVIDHSRAKQLILTSRAEKNNIILTIEDNGLGALYKLGKTLSLNDYRDVILELTKGKQTSDPEKHSGEGIFFSSKIFDYFTLESNGFCYSVDNIEKDYFLKTLEPKTSGTKIILEIHRHAKRKLIDVFQSFQDPENFSFNRTYIHVELAKLEGERFISRSQAKRILRGLAEKFTHIVLDFKQVRIVGQGFVDEVFRVFKNQHSHIMIEYCNANPDVEFMIKRGIISAEKNL